MTFRSSLLAVAGLALSILAGPPLARAQTPAPPAHDWPAPQAANFEIKDFVFASGERLANLRIHYMTLGAPHRDAQGEIDNAVLILHGTGGSGAQFLRPFFADQLYGKGQLLDASRYFIILPDDIGHGASSKPSDGMHARFPHYDYGDMVTAEHALVTQGLGIKRLRLIMGTSMGCMHAFMWGETYPHEMKALMPLACLPTAIVGRNRLWRDMLIEAIKADPAWNGGDYQIEPEQGLRTAEDILTLAGSAPLVMQHQFDDQAKVEAYLSGPMAAARRALDANDLIYQVDSSRDYDPSPRLEAIVAPVMWVNSADDFINPPELGIAQALSPRLAHGTFVLLPISPLTHGHGTHTWAAAWKDHLAKLLAESEN